MKITKKFLEAFSGSDAVKSVTRKKDYVEIVRNNGETSLIPSNVYNASVSRAMDQLRRDLDLLKSNHPDEEVQYLSGCFHLQADLWKL